MARQTETQMTESKDNELTRDETDRIIMMAWEDRQTDEGGRMKAESVSDAANPFILPPSSLSLPSTTKHEAKFAETDAGGEPRRFRAKSQRG